MTNQTNAHPAHDPRGDLTPPSATRRTTALAITALLCGAAVAQHDRPAELRRFVGEQVGGIEKLMVPALDSELPQPRRADGTVDPRFQTTEQKRYLGKLLYFDPIRTARILPQFGGALETRQTGSCGSCHLGEADSRAGTLINLGVGGEGRGYTDAHGRFVERRRPRAGLVDTVPTLTEIFDGSGRLVMSGAADAVDSVPRNVPSMVGFAFNNRLLQGGLIGEPANSPAGSNPDGLPAQENLTQATLAAHRMVQFQSAELQRFPVYQRLFRTAFPAEAAMADAANDLNLLINDDTVLRAMASFLRTIVTRDTPWDRFLAGDNGALTRRQRQGARLFFTPATQGGAGCVSCHSGPMLNKQLGDEQGLLVEQNFVNLGLADHPLQRLNAQVFGDPAFRDTGRMEVTGHIEDAFEFRVLTLRQLKDAGLFMHNGAFTSVRQVVDYFNAGMPQDAQAGAAATLSLRFTQPRGPGTPRGLGLDDEQVAALTDFLENALYDAAFVRFDARSPTPTFEPTLRDLTYSVFRPDLAALGAVDGLMPSRLPRSNNDALSRRDMGLEFLDVTSRLDLAVVDSTERGGRRSELVYRVTNSSAAVVDTHLLLVVDGLSQGARLENDDGTTRAGAPYVRVFLPDGVLQPGQSIAVTLRFRRDAHAPSLAFSLRALSGQGNP